MKSKDYAKTGTYYLVGNLFNKGIAFLTIIIYTRILTAYDYGIINTFSSWVGILSMILGMSLQNSIRVAFVDFKEKLAVHWDIYFVFPITPQQVDQFDLDCWNVFISINSIGVCFYKN